MSMFGFIYDPLMMILMLPGLLLGIYAQMKLRGTYSRYIEVPASSGISGAEAAREILDSAGLTGMPVEMVQGHLTDHYDPMKKALFLSEENYRGRSLAAIGVAAHEAGHALQHRAAYFPLHFRMALVPVTNFASRAAIYILIAGVIMSMTKLVLAGIIAFSILVLFHLVTLPVEFDASRRAKQQLQKLGLLRDPEEAQGVSRVLSAAAMTYVAALVVAVFELLYWVLRFSHMRK